MPDEVALYYRSLFPRACLVLDVGCGRGDFLWPGAVGLDLDHAALLHARHKHVVEGSAAVRLPFRESVFDGVLAKDVLEHLQNPRFLMDELWRVTKPRGQLVLVTPRGVPRAVWADYTHVRGFSRSALQALLQDAGWTLLKLHRMGGVPFAGRFGLVGAIPKVLAIPGLGHYWGTNWQAIARRGD